MKTLGALFLALLCGARQAQDQPQSDAAKAAATAKEHVYKKTEQGELKIYVYSPADLKPEDKRPAIVFYYGGAWTGGTTTQFAIQAAYLAGRGMVAACVDYRVKSRHQVTPDKCVEDAKSAMRWVRKNAPTLGVDPDRIVAAGGSAGGHLAACMALVEGFDAAGEDASISTRPCALVLFNPALAYDPVASRMNDPETAKKIAPNLLIRKDQPPALVLFGTADRMIDAGREFEKRSKELGNKVEFYTAEGQPHGFFNRSPWRERTLYRADEFLASLGYLQGKPTLPLPKDEK